MLNISTEELYDLSEKGLTQEEIAGELSCSTATISNRMAKIKSQQGILLKYREVQSLHLTALQAKILENITEEKIQEASLSELVAAFRILKDKELVVDGKPTQIKSLISYLVEIEKQDAALDSVGEAEIIEEQTVYSENYTPRL